MPKPFLYSTWNKNQDETWERNVHESWLQIHVSPQTRSARSCGPTRQTRDPDGDPEGSNGSSHSGAVCSNRGKQYLRDSDRAGETRTTSVYQTHPTSPCHWRNTNHVSPYLKIVIVLDHYLAYLVYIWSQKKEFIKNKLFITYEQFLKLTKIVSALKHTFRACYFWFRIEVQFKGYPPPIISWYRDNFEIHPSHDFQVKAWLLSHMVLSTENWVTHDDFWVLDIFISFCSCF